MDLFEALKNRISVRQFAAAPIPKETLEKIIDAGRFAATARNVQPWEFVVVTDSKVLGKIASLAENGRFLADSKACIAVFSADSKYYLEDGCAATQNMLLAATALGIGSCWVAGDKKPYCEEICSMLGAPKGFKLVSLIALGLPKDKDALKPVEKRPLKELLHWEKF